MRIEKLSENQLRCTLNQSDLTSYELKMSELAYGTERAKVFFKELMQEASRDYGFDAENIPLMIEAIPVSKDSIVLIVTKIEDQETLDEQLDMLDPATRDDLSLDDDDDFFDDSLPFDSTFDILDTIDAEEVFRQGFSELDFGKPFANKSAPYIDGEPKKRDSASRIKSKTNAAPVFLVFSFESIDDFGRAAYNINSNYNAKNSLYKNTSNGRYYLILSDRDEKEVYDLDIICSALSDYGKKEQNTQYFEAYMKEHGVVVIKNNAISVIKEVVS